MNLLYFFIFLSIVNVIGSTIKSIITVNGSKWIASAVNAVYFGFYTIVLIYMNCDLTMWQKVIVTAICNFIGVFIVKTIEERRKPERLWKIEMAVRIPPSLANTVKENIEKQGIPCNYQQAGKWFIYNCYCSSKEETNDIKVIALNLQGKISAYESKINI